MQNARNAEERGEWAGAVDNWNLALLTVNQAEAFAEDHQMLDADNQSMAQRWNNTAANFQVRLNQATARLNQQQNRRCEIM